jgi:hypothetical protein
MSLDSQKGQSLQANIVLQPKTTRNRQHQSPRSSRVLENEVKREKGENLQHVITGAFIDVREKYRQSN